MNLHHLCCAIRVVLHFQPCAPCFCDVSGRQSLIQPALPFWKTIRKGDGSAQCILALPDNVCCDIQQRTSVSQTSVEVVLLNEPTTFHKGGWGLRGTIVNNKYKMSLKFSSIRLLKQMVKCRIIQQKEKLVKHFDGFWFTIGRVQESGCCSCPLNIGQNVSTLSL